MMKTPQLLLVFGILLTLQSCLKDDCERTVSYIQLEPVYKSLEEIHSGTVVMEEARSLENPGQIYYYNNHIFINERGAGIHVIDNADPSNPLNVRFLAVEGNEDLAIKDGVLYANTYIDLLAIDLQSYQLTGRAENVFPPMWQDLSSGQVLVEYKEVPKTEVMDCETYNSLERRGDIFFSFNESANVDFDNISTTNQSVNSSTAGGGVGVGGSMARFTIMGDYLYAIDESGMDLFNLTGTNPSHAGRVEIGWGIETIFPYEDKLFIGSNSGMFIYDNSVPTQPTQLSEFEHARACDPVYVKDNYAYVTLRSGNACEGFTDQLDLIDITVLTSPVLKKTFQMDNPHGLSIRGDKLFLCEGEFGLKSFDISEPLNLGDHQLDEIGNIHAFDAISLPGNNEVVMVIGDDGFYQYTSDDLGQLELLSKIAIKR